MKIFCFDIDGTLCSKSPENYEDAVPYSDRIEQVNKLYDEGNSIIIFTARGSATGIDHKELTKNQLREWGLKYNELIFGKPNADYYIDDKSRDYFNWFIKEE
ncbi:MAG: hypothetical protein CMA27_05250 [Euryarchaeota archaeon]|nr:hypothetical protein [Euryarchaeota archaeon]|tara:strand:- start:425 stop:730 length:306 start_codon:yes stop_codon:yes gene_type:complete